MKLILLASNSPHNREWIMKMEEALKGLFEKTYVLEYEHWKTGHGLIDFDKELKRLSHEMQGECIIFAKSAGVALAVKGINEEKIKPKKCLFLSTPFFWAKDNDIPLEQWFENYSVPTIFIQKTGDPVIGFSELKEKLAGLGVTRGKFVKIEGNGRDYDDIELIQTQMKKLIGK